MLSIYHEGELHIQSKMGIDAKRDNLINMVRKDMPFLAYTFLKELNLCVLVLNTNEKNLFSTAVYGLKSFIEIKDDMKIIINLENCSFIPKDFFEKELLNIGFIGLNFELARRIRINGKAKIENNQIIVDIEELYSNCPKYFNKRILHGQLEKKGKVEIYRNYFMDEDFINVITNSDTFFLSSFHKDKGLDISHKGGENGFVKVLSPTKLEFMDKKGNNVYNSLGNIYTNPYANMLFIDFDRHSIYQLFVKVEIEETYFNETKQLKIIIFCIDVVKNTNCFLLDYKNKN
jgi:uncharacterized protein